MLKEQQPDRLDMSCRSKHCWSDKQELGMGCSLWLASTQLVGQLAEELVQPPSVV
jgi:hypothetical protein